MAEIKFYANIAANDSQTLIDHTANSGLGFYGNAFGVSVPIGSQQSTTFVTNADGTVNGVALNNTKYANTDDNRNLTTGLVVASDVGANPLALNLLPNYACPLNIRFNHTSAVRVQNCKLRIFDRNDINNHASGVTTYVYEVRHPLASTTASNLDHRAPGVSNNAWTIFENGYAAMTDMPFTASPGVSGINTSSTDTSLDAYYAANNLTSSNYKQGALHSSTRHDWYLALSSEPNTIGSKTQYGLYFSVEYL
jgi:hypothetical protein